MELTRLNTRLRVNPAILKGSNNNHIIGKRIIISKATGQQTMNKKHQRIKAKNVLIFFINDTSIIKPDI
jgi:hypothetical protein